MILIILRKRKAVKEENVKLKLFCYYLLPIFVGCVVFKVFGIRNKKAKHVNVIELEALKFVSMSPCISRDSQVLMKHC